MYTRPAWPESFGETSGGGPPPLIDDKPDDVGIPTGGILGARMRGAPAGVGDRMLGKAVSPAIGDVMKRAASEIMDRLNVRQINHLKNYIYTPCNK